MMNEHGKKRVLILGINFKPEITGIGKYTGEMADWLVKHDYECTVVTSFPYYPNWKIQEPYRGRSYKKEVLNDGKMRVYRCPLYVPKTPSGLKRILQESTFFFSAALLLIYLFFKKGNTHIMCMAPPFHLGFLALFYRFFKGGKILYHIQDLQIEAAKDLNIIKTDKIFSLLFAFERYILKRVDFVSTISDGMLQKVRSKTNKEILFFPNWVDVGAFYPVQKRMTLKARWGFNEGDKLVVYSGSIGEKQGLESLIPIAKSLEKFEAIKFVICGGGPYLEKLKQLAITQGLQNLFFMPLQPTHLFNDFLNMVDVHLILQKRSACDLVMPSKLSTILAVGGLALVTAEPGSTLHTILKKFEMGLVIECDDATQLRSAIVETCLLNHAKLNRNARAYAENFLDRDRILSDIMLKIQDIVHDPLKVSEPLAL